jgi:hypothetical protein
MMWMKQVEQPAYFVWLIDKSCAHEARFTAETRTLCVPSANAEKSAVFVCFSIKSLRTPRPSGEFLY